MASVAMTVNGQAVTRDVEPRTLLVEFLRQHLDLPAPTSAATPASAAPAWST